MRADYSTVLCEYVTTSSRCNARSLPQRGNPLSWRKKDSAKRATGLRIRDAPPKWCICLLRETQDGNVAPFSLAKANRACPQRTPYAFPPWCARAVCPNKVANTCVRTRGTDASMSGIRRTKHRSTLQNLKSCCRCTSVCVCKGLRHVCVCVCVSESRKKALD